MEGYFENTLNFLSEVTRRKRIVREELKRLGDCNCKNASDTPCCLLRTELDILQKCQDALERELWHLKGGSNGSV